MTSQLIVLRVRGTLFIYEAEVEEVRGRACVQLRGNSASKILLKILDSSALRSCVNAQPS